MRYLPLSLIAVMGLGVLLVAAACVGGGEPLTKEVAEPVVEGNSRFAVELYGRLVAHDKTVEGGGNLFFSPYSISTALAMTWAGAGGQTERDMAKTMHFTLGQEELHSLLGAMQKQLNQGGQKGGYQLSVANALWGQKGYPFLDDYLEVVERLYGGRLSNVDFANNGEQARVTINDWVEAKTNEKIKDLIPRGVLSPLTRLVLTNAIYFKGDWAKKFKEDSTRDAPFHVASDKTVQVPMMYQKGRFRYGRIDKAQVVELGYKGGDLSMMIVLPDAVDGLAELERSLTVEQLRKMQAVQHEEEILVYLPKFRMEWGSGSLKKDLSAMGMGVAFSDDADFSGMDGTEFLYISDVVHKAFVEVNEEGTEAAAATGVVMTLKSAPRFPIFRADRPFMFVIRDNRLGSILFMGRVVNPASKGE